MVVLWLLGQHHHAGLPIRRRFHTHKIRPAGLPVFNESNGVFSCCLNAEWSGLLGIYCFHSVAVGTAYSLLIFVLVSMSFLVSCACSSPIYLLLLNFWRSIRLLIEAKNGFIDFIGDFNCGLVFMG